MLVAELHLGLPGEFEILCSAEHQQEVEAEMPYIVQEHPVVFPQNDRRGRNIGEPIPGSAWHVVDALSGQRVGDPYYQKGRAEAACQRLNEEEGDGRD